MTSSVKELFTATTEDHRPRVVLTSGTQGVGKSRLAAEFLAYLEGMGETVYWHGGRCASYGLVAFGALAQIVRQRLSLPENAPKQQVATALADQLPQWLLDAEERRFVEVRLGVLLGTADAPQLDQTELFAGWRLFFERLTAVHPVVIVVEDLQWADEGLLQFLEHLLDRTSRAPIFLLATAHPELAEQHPDWMSGRRAFSLLPVDPLSDPVMRQFIDTLVPNLPDGAVEQLVTYAQGVPLYAVETVRALIDRGLITPLDGALCLTGDIIELDTPASLTALIAARLDALPTPERDMLLRLAVLGSTFPRAAVAAVTDQLPAQVDRLLDALVRKDILTITDNPLSPDRGRYTFTQHLLRAVAYTLVARRQRARWHTAVADHLRAALPNDGEDFIELIAAHYTDAHHHATHPQKESLRDQAMCAHERAGHRAGTLGAPNTGQHHYQRAAELATTEPERTRYIALQAHMAFQAGHAEEPLASTKPRPPPTPSLGATKKPQVWPRTWAIAFCC